MRIVFSIVKHKENGTSYHTTIILLCETTFVDVADDSFFLGTFDGFCFTFEWKKWQWTLKKVETELWYLFTLINKLHAKFIDIHSVDGDNGCCCCCFCLCRYRCCCFALHSIQRLFLKAISIDKCNVHTKQWIQKVRSYIFTHQPSMAIRYKYAEYMGLFHHIAPVFFHRPLSLSASLTLFTVASVPFMEFTIIMDLRKCGRLMQQQNMKCSWVISSNYSTYTSYCVHPQYLKGWNAFVFRSIFKSATKWMQSAFLFDSNTAHAMSLHSSS